MTQLLNSGEGTSATWRIWKCSRWEWLKGHGAMQKKQCFKNNFRSHYFLDSFSLNPTHSLTQTEQLNDSLYWDFVLLCYDFQDTDYNAVRFGGLDIIPSNLFLPTVPNHFCEKAGVRDSNGHNVKPIWLTTHVCALIRAIFAVRLSIAVPSLGETLAIAADKVLRRARLPHCNRDMIKIKASRAYKYVSKVKNNKLSKDFTSGAKVMSQNSSSVLIYCIHRHSLTQNTEKQICVFFCKIP